MAALERIYDFFLPSEFRDSADERRARVLLPAAVWMIVACLFFLLPLGAFQILGQRFLILGFSFAGLGLFILILLRYGHSVFAGYLVVGGLLLAANLQPVFSEGIYDTIYMLNILSIVTAGVLFGQRSVILVAMMAAAASLLLAYHTENGNILVRSADLMENRPGPYVEWFRRCSYLFMTVVLYWLGWKATNRALTASDETRSENRSLSRVLTNVLEQGQLGHWYWNIRTGEVYWSSNVAAIFGIPAAEFQGSFEAFLNLVLPEDRDHIRRALNRAFSDPASNYQVQHRIRNASNHIRWLEGRGTVRFEAGRPMDMAGVVVDITEQKRAQSALDRVYSILAEGIVIHDSSDAIVSFNESALEILELTGDQLRGKTTRDPGWSLVNVNGEPIKPDQMPSRICMRTGEPQYDITLGVQLANGTIRWLSVSAIPFSEDDSEQRGAVVSFFDITAPRNQSRELQKSEEQLRFILENQPSVVLMLDLDGTILYINNPTAGYRAEDIIGLHSSSFVPPEDRPRFQEYLRRIQVEQEPFSYDIRGYNSNGEISWFSTRIGLLEFQDQKRIILISTDVTDRVEAEQRLRTMAYTDLLTGLPNREALYSHLRRVVENANSEGPLQKDTARSVGEPASADGTEGKEIELQESSRYAILFVDLDHFKNINDTLGHDVGDQLLNQVAGRFRNQLSDKAFLARLGGDEFMMVYEVQKDEEATEHARNILGLFRGPLQVDGHDLYLSASIGLCFFPGDGEDIHQLIKNADAAMYKAKARGRNNYCRFEKAMETEIQARLLMDTELRGAAANSELLLHFQPVFDLMSREITGMEALLRWNNPHLGQVSPGVFIPLAEETGSIRELDLWTMESGIQQLARWREEGVFAGRLALNMSARQLENQDFIPRLSGLLQQHALRGSDISLELTETALMKNIAAMTPLLETMGDMGIELMIDDFGTGYSSLNYLKRLPVHVVKIDRSFVEEIGTEESDSIVRTIIAMARTLDLKVIAEGVETEEQFQFLRREGCDLVQGFYLARPADEAAIRSILLRGVAPSPSANGEA